MLDQSVRPKRILVVDDEATLVFFLKRDLQEEATTVLNVDAASSGEDALTKLTYSRYDLLITDLNMPGISGFTLAEIARSLYPDIKVILMTAFGSREVQAEAQNLNADGYLTKPFPTAQLRDMVSNILIASNQGHPR